MKTEKNQSKEKSPSVAVIVNDRIVELTDGVCVRQKRQSNRDKISRIRRAKTSK